jgi:hypothetical protein
MARLPYGAVVAGAGLLLAACRSDLSGTASSGAAAAGTTGGITGAGGASGALGPAANLASGSGGNWPGAPGGSPGSGASGAGAAGVGGGGSGQGTAGMSAGAPNPLDVGNYFASGAWRGYVWTSTSGAGSTITPMDFAGQTTGMPRCVRGSVAASANYGGTAVLGVNLSEGTGVTSMTVTPSKAGVLVDVTNHAGSPLRFQVKSAMSGGTEWCTALTGSGGFIPWTSLRTNCWDDSGTAYNGQPIASAMLLVPGTNTAPVAFDFCWNALAEADGPVGGNAGAGGTGSGGTGAAGSGAAGADGPTVPPLTGGCDGFATRYWDCCKPHCGWSGNVSSGPLASCDASDNSLGGNFDVGSSCSGGSAYLCHSQTPWALSNRLSYGFAAVSARAGSDICGKCYQLDFTGGSRSGSDPGSAALSGKSMIVQAINIGGDVGSGQIDIAIPGGGVGAFNACSDQWDVPSSQLGATYGGFLTTCKQGGASDLSAIKSCVMQRCTSVLEQRGLSELFAACRWFVDWFEAADNPTLRYAEVACPSELMNRGMRRGGGAGGSCLR